MITGYVTEALDAGLFNKANIARVLRLLELEIICGLIVVFDETY
jgi:hypothetical protein